PVHLRGGHRKLILWKSSDGRPVRCNGCPAGPHRISLRWSGDGRHNSHFCGSPTSTFLAQNRVPDAARNPTDSSSSSQATPQMSSRGTGSRLTRIAWSGHIVGPAKERVLHSMIATLAPTGLPTTNWKV